MTGTGKNVREFAMIGFLLLAVLFGMIISTIIFGFLSPLSSDTFSKLTGTVINESGYALNGTVYSIPVASNPGFTGGFVIIEVRNESNGILLTSANYTVDTNAGTIVNASAQNWVAVNISYTYNYKSTSQITTEKVSNDSLASIGAYSSNSSSQFTTLTVSIILILLLAVFAVFWKTFLGKNKARRLGGGNY